MAGYTHGVQYSEELAREMVADHASGMTVEDVCRKPGRPCSRTFRSWCSTYAWLDEAMKEARPVAMDEIASRARRTIRGKTEDQGGESTGDVQRDRAIVELDLKLLSKWDHGRYGDMTSIKHSGEIGKRELTDEELDAEIAKRLSAAS